MLNDFGLARNLNATRTFIKTDTGHFGGTIEYNSPERIKGDENAAKYLDK